MKIYEEEPVEIVNKITFKDGKFMRSPSPMRIIIYPDDNAEAETILAVLAVITPSEKEK